jgi:hypothetical protein
MRFRLDSTVSALESGPWFRTLKDPTATVNGRVSNTVVRPSHGSALTTGWRP